MMLKYPFRGTQGVARWKALLAFLGGFIGVFALVIACTVGVAGKSSVAGKLAPTTNNAPHRVGVRDAISLGCNWYGRAQYCGSGRLRTRARE
ncbi:hypothetical protein D2E47_16795 [Mycobacteroides abscessus]|nr:hypothetical protein D2E47_16795 [Mycobacteroides abscessus]RIU14515.1 hypothetical protein D2F01_00680 [Mycobacteroides abscessus]